jgi:beta-lactamase superfamily II metal-dependent hydrolase
LPKLQEIGLSPRVLSRDHSAFPVVHIGTDTFSDAKIQNTVNNFNNRYNSPVSWDVDPTNPSYNGGIKIEMKFARKKDKNSEEPNSYSSIISVEYMGWKILLTGDNNKEILNNRIAEEAEFSNWLKGCHILLAPHHGRETDFCENFFNLANPLITIVSDKNIEYGSQETTSTNYCNDKGLYVNGSQEKRQVLTTRKDGTISVWISDEGKYDIKTGATSYGR